MTCSDEEWFRPYYVLLLHGERTELRLPIWFLLSFILLPSRQKKKLSSGNQCCKPEFSRTQRPLPVCTAFSVGKQWSSSFPRVWRPCHATRTQPRPGRSSPLEKRQNRRPETAYLLGYSTNSRRRGSCIKGAKAISVITKTTEWLWLPKKTRMLRLEMADIGLLV